jgi:lysophospholipase L1-like esterase
VAWRIARINDLLAELAAATPGVTMSAEPTTLDADDLAEDGFHPGPQGYCAWAEYLAGLALGNSNPP